MLNKNLLCVACVLPALLSACGNEARLDLAAGTGPDPVLPAPDASLIPAVNIAPARPWAEGQMPTPGPGLSVNAFASGLEHPRWLYVLPNGDVLVAESNGPERPENATGIRGWVMKKVMARAGAGAPSADRITLLRDSNHDGIVDERHIFVQGLHSPFGMALVDGTFYAANTDGVVTYNYPPGAVSIDGPGRSLTDLPAGPINHHWTKNILASPNGETLYATVGSNSNVAENGLAAEHKRAAIWAIDRRSGQHRIYATGLRNPNGMALIPQPDGSQQLWTVINERDEIGGDLVPDYMTFVTDGGFYGWPYSYYGQHVDDRVQPQKPELVATAIKPDYALGPHTASLGLAYSDHNALGADYATGVFVGQHGSWNRKPHSGYRVVFIRFDDGQPQGLPTIVLDDFLDQDGNARGRPVGVALARDGALLVADDVGNTIWRVTRTGP